MNLFRLLIRKLPRAYASNRTRRNLVKAAVIHAFLNQSEEGALDCAGRPGRRKDTSFFDCTSALAV